MKLYQALANKVHRFKSLQKQDEHTQLEDNVVQQIYDLVGDHLPHGSGFDSGTTIDLDASTDNKLVFDTSFHHMNDNGYYDGWTEHRVTVRGSLLFDITITVSGSNKRDIKDYIGELFHDALTEDIQWPLPTDQAKYQAAVEYARAHPIGTTSTVVRGDAE